jgi:hypothetical protein
VTELQTWLFLPARNANERREGRLGYRRFAGSHKSESGFVEIGQPV